MEAGQMSLVTMLSDIPASTAIPKTFDLYERIDRDRRVGGRYIRIYDNIHIIVYEPRRVMYISYNNNNS